VRGAEAASPLLGGAASAAGSGAEDAAQPAGFRPLRKTSIYCEIRTKAISRGLPDTCPAGGCLSIENRRLWIRKPSSGGRERKPIDIFFSALATDCGDHAAAVRR
jgi:hypothetical protein